MKAVVVQRPHPGVDAGHAQGLAHKEQHPGRDNERRRISRERHVPSHQPGHERRHDTAGGQENDAGYSPTKEEESGDPHQHGIEAVDPGG